MTGFRNPGKDQQLELNLGRAWEPEGLEPLLIPFQICLQPSSTTAILAPFQQETLRLLTSPTSIEESVIAPATGALWKYAAGTAVSSCSPAIGWPCQQRTEHTSPVHSVHSAPAGQCRLRPGLLDRDKPHAQSRHGTHRRQPGIN